MKIKTIFWIIGCFFLLRTAAGGGLWSLAGEDDAIDFGYSGYASVLSRFVDGRGRVDYAGLKADRGALDEFAGDIAELDRSRFEEWGEADRLAFWINAYNALVLKAVIDHYPIRASFFASLRFPRNSIRQISGGWDEIQFTVMGRMTTLKEIKDEVIRKEFGEARVHSALACAAVGGPPLRRAPFTGDGLDGQLDDQVRAMLGDPGKFHIDFNAKVIYLSEIFDWHGEDFIAKYDDSNQPEVRSRKQRAVIRFLADYAGEERSKALRSYQYRVAYLDFDWSLNEQERP
ncbi:MAG: DUF547 domain-containing protein [Candidatus Omnitrophica bacterium]|nr:DUF547 domain-containing protein [Candidatus Omnitrophota bacterium]